MPKRKPAKRTTKKSPAKRATGSPAKVKNQMMKQFSDRPESEQRAIWNSLSEAIFGVGDLGTQMMQTATLFENTRWYLVSNMRQLLSEIYVEHGLIQVVVDVPVDDGMRGGVEIKTKQLEPEQIEKLEAYMEQQGDMDVMAQTLKWNRLFGGAGVLVITDGQYDKPLSVNEVKKGSRLKFRACDLWELFHTHLNTADRGADVGSYVDFDPEYFNYYGHKVHHSRVMKVKGMEAPSFIRPRMRGWGMSVVEAVIAPINQFIKANNLTFDVLDEFKVDWFKIKNLTSSLMEKNGAAKIQERIRLANAQKNFQHAIVMDGEDDFGSKELNFAGISDVMVGIRMQVASALRMPLTKVFGISSAGFSSGEDDIENYNAMVESTVRKQSKFHILKMIELRCMEIFGMVPSDMSIEFKPLRILSATQEEEVKNSQYNRLLAAKTAGEITSEEFRDACNKENLLPIQLETDDATLGALEDMRMQKGDEAKEVANPKGAKSATEPPLAKNSLGNRNIACVALICDGRILTGQRKDSGKWTFPGGHFEPGEDPISAAGRELVEESGISFPARHDRGKKVTVETKEGGVVTVFPFICYPENRDFASTIFDPDQEVTEWKWVELKSSTPELFDESRHHKNDVMIELLKQKGMIK